jgi:hypothetical protein
MRSPASILEGVFRCTFTNVWTRKLDLSSAKTTSGTLHLFRILFRYLHQELASMEKEAGK